MHKVLFKTRLEIGNRNVKKKDSGKMNLNMHRLLNRARWGTSFLVSCVQLSKINQLKHGKNKVQRKNPNA